jgi:hypothetical protein
MSRTIELAGTCLEGLEHAKSKMNECDFENGVIMMHDAVYGYYQVEKSLQLLSPDIPANQLEPLGHTLRNSLALVTSACEQGEMAKALAWMQFIVVPNYKKWQAELSRCLEPYIVS